MKEQDEPQEKVLIVETVEISNFPYKEFKVTVLKVFTDLRRMNTENLGKEIENEESTK